MRPLLELVALGTQLGKERRRQGPSSLYFTSLWWNKLAVHSYKYNRIFSPADCEITIDYRLRTVKIKSIDQELGKTCEIYLRTNALPLPPPEGDSAVGGGGWPSRIFVSTLINKHWGQVFFVATQVYHTTSIYPGWGRSHCIADWGENISYVIREK